MLLVPVLYSCGMPTISAAFDETLRSGLGGGQPMLSTGLRHLLFTPALTKWWGPLDLWVHPAFEHLGVNSLLVSPEGLWQNVQSLVLLKDSCGRSHRSEISHSTVSPVTCAGALLLFTCHDLACFSIICCFCSQIPASWDHLQISCLYWRACPRLSFGGDLN